MIFELSALFLEIETLGREREPCLPHARRGVWLTQHFAQILSQRVRIAFVAKLACFSILDAFNDTRVTCRGQRTT